MNVIQPFSGTHAHVKKIIKLICQWWVACVVLFLVTNTLMLSATDQPLVQSYATGYAITAQAVGLEGALKNPASVIIKKHNVAMLNLNKRFGMDIYDGFVALGYAVGDSTYVALSIPLTQVNQIKETSVVNNAAQEIGTFSSIQMQPRVTVQKQINNHLSLGGSIIAMIDDVYNESALGFAGDIGVLCQFNRLNLGASLQQIGWSKTWSTGRTESKAMQLNIGTTLKLNKQVDFLTDISIIEEGVELNVGTRIALLQSLDLLAGVRDIQQRNDIRVGVEFNLSSINLHYAYGIQQQLGQSHKFGFSFDY